jgi:hypothetical protein
MCTLARNVDCKTAAQDVVSALHAEGLLTANLGDVRHKIKRSIKSHADILDATYGALVKNIVIDGVTIDYIDPRCWLSYMCSVSDGFASMMASTSRHRSSLSIVVYNDGVVPGNPFRPDKGRHVETFYWCIAEWPDYILQRSICWPTLAILRTVALRRISAGLPRVMREMVRILNALSTGVSPPLYRFI